MKPNTEHRKFESTEAYLASEEKSEVRHEYYFENLIEISDVIELPLLQISIALKDIYQA